MSDDLIRYDLIVQEALRNAVRKVLADVAHDGLPGDHHFFITFKTAAPGVQLSDRMRKEYPDEMTIVLQHQFWDMNVDDTHFEVGLSFRNVPEKLSIPFDALTGFADPSVQFALRFETDLASPPEEEDATSADIKSQSPTTKPSGLAAPADSKELAYFEAERERTRTAARGKESVKPAPANKDAGETGADDTPDGSDSAGSKVVSIDAFRKKT